MTRQRAMIVELLKDHDEFDTAQHIHEMLAENGSKVGIATVYRNLQAMAAGGEVDVLHIDGEALYRACDAQEHHHHIVCRECGKTVEIEIPGFEQWIRTHANRHGYTDIHHTVEIFGLCPECSEKAAH
ncbi:MAG: transcriptional repressor [Bifidobacteriaceae bacterium]|jgi:Fur family ferric uptake transcriptional regulator|nr:transcriptional repressor [Bifidobacteriaceae bacterium]